MTLRVNKRVISRTAQGIARTLRIVKRMISRTFIDVGTVDILIYETSAYDTWWFGAALL